MADIGSVGPSGGAFIVLSWIVLCAVKRLDSLEAKQAQYHKALVWTRKSLRALGVKVPAEIEAIGPWEE